MEKIEIKDMVTLRFYALVIAKGNGPYFGTQGKTEIDKAKEYESYIKGDASLPEVFDPHADTKAMIDVFKENMPKPTPISDTLAECLKKAWLNADKMKPADKNPVLCALKYGSKYEYCIMQWIPENGIWFNDELHEDTSNHVVAWQPISEPNVYKLIPGKWYPVSESHKIVDGDYVLVGRFTDKGEIRDCMTAYERYRHFIDDTFGLEYHATHFMLIPSLED